MVDRNTTLWPGEVVCTVTFWACQSDHFGWTTANAAGTEISPVSQVIFALVLKDEDK
jgi:hypothetical protein